MLKDFLKEYFDYKLFITVLLLVGIGLISIYSATYTAGSRETFEKQIFWIILGELVLITIFLIPLRFIELASLPLYGCSLLLLIAVPFIGQTVYGSTSWFNLGSFKVQPSEFTKITTILVLANYLSRKNVDITKFKDIIISGLFVLVPFALIMLQPDFGTATVYLFIYLTMVFWAGTKIFYVYAVAATGLAMLSAVLNLYFLFITIFISIVILIYLRENWNIIFTFCGYLLAVGFSFDYFYDHLAMYQQKRIATFLDPSKDPLGAGYNAIQAKVAIGSGGIFGKGFLQGTQTQLKFIPKQWTDFIFCVPGEEFGFIGSLLVLFLLFFVLYRSLKIASSVKSRFPSLVAIGILATLLYHIIINLGMSLGLLPVMGLPLPFMSYGGSVLLSGMIMIGLLLNFYSHRKDH
jgi:rod shape determining protein RodA